MQPGSGFWARIIPSAAGVRVSVQPGYHGPRSDPRSDRMGCPRTPRRLVASLGPGGLDQVRRGTPPRIDIRPKNFLEIYVAQ